MKLNIRSELLDIEKKPIKTKPGVDAPDATLGDICVTALTTDTEEAKNEPGEKKFHRWQLARRIKNALDTEGAAEIDLPVEDVTLIKGRIAKVFMTTVAGPAWEAIERQ